MARTLGTPFLALVVSACATSRPAPAPPMESFTLGMWRASYRDYAGSRTSICSAEPAWLQDQLSSVNGVLRNWLEATARPWDEEWTREELDLLRDGARSLPPLVDVHEQNLKDLAACRFSDDRAYPDLRERGQEFVRQVRERVEAAPQIRGYRAAIDDYALWKRERHLRETDARVRCPSRPNPRQTPPIYYAWKSDEGRVQWLFCGGARVTRSPGGELSFDPPYDLSPKAQRRLQPKVYFNAAAKFPEARVDRPPAIPEPQGMTAAEP